MRRLYVNHFLFNLDRWLLELEPTVVTSTIRSDYYFRKSRRKQLISHANIAIIASGCGWENLMRLEICKDLFESSSTLNRTQWILYRILFGGLLLAIPCLFGNPATAQTATPSEINAHLQAGEFSVALKLADSLPSNSRDNWLSKISAHQFDSGAYQTAYQTAGMIDGELPRSDSLSGLYANHNRPPATPRGGITESDFLPLIDLITGTIQPDSWLDTGQGLGTIQAFPAGVFVNSSGVLSKIRARKANGSAEILRQAVAQTGRGILTWSSPLRKISLTRLERAAQLLTAQGHTLDESMRNLAGLYAITHLIFYPETGEIVIAGPAGPWEFDEHQRAINLRSGKPILQLDDLVNCLRNANSHDGKFGCSITPRQENLVATKNFLASTTLTGRQWSEKAQSTLGEQDIEVFGIPRGTHTARVLVEADYRMKLLGMGLEKSIPEIPSYMDRLKLKPDGTLPAFSVVRWWFTLNDQPVSASPDETVFTFNGSTVKVLSENEFVNQDGDRIHTGKSDIPTRGFARDFTAHFNKISDKYPVYNQLKNIFDLALVAEIVRQKQATGKASWEQTFFGLPKEPTSSNPIETQLAYPMKNDHIATKVKSVISEKHLRSRQPDSRRDFHILGVSGGVSVSSADQLTKSIIQNSSSELDDRLKNQTPDLQVQRWWWD
ncbi:DUF1598 domain-containing protein [bacterium]|nr:DUF1598 domain-containing protein [bacterium]